MLNEHLQQTIHCDQICAVGDSDSSEGSRTELDSHANMPVVGKHCFILADTGKTAEVSPYTLDYDAMDVKIVDAAVIYKCPFTHFQSISS